MLEKVVGDINFFVLILFNIVFKADIKFNVASFLWTSDYSRVNKFDTDAIITFDVYGISSVRSGEYQNSYSKRYRWIVIHIGSV